MPGLITGPPSVHQFSVVIPVFNMEATIGRCLNGVLEQTTAPMEVIVVDDGSTDASIDVALALCPAVRVFHQHHQGAGSARNLGAKMARSEWVAFLDADDVWLPGHLAELSRIRNLYPEAKLISTSWIESLDGMFDPPSNARGRIRSADFFREAASNKAIIWTSSAAANANALLSVGGFSGDLRSQDLVGWVRLALVHGVAVSDTVTAIYLREPKLLEQKARTYHALLSPSPVHQTLVDGNDIGRAIEYSPAAREVLQALERGDHVHDARKLEAFVDRSVKNDLRYSLSTGDCMAVRQQRRMFIQATRLSNAPDVLLAWMPPWLSRCGVRVHRWLRRGVLGVARAGRTR